MENRKSVPGFETKYEIDISVPEGICWSLDYRCTGKKHPLSNTPRGDGRIRWELNKDGKKETQQAARWIAITFPELVHNEYFEGAEIDHIDTNPLNNHPSNLRWVTSKENQNNPLTLKHMSETHIGYKVKQSTKEKISKAQRNRKDLSRWVIKLNKNNEILHFYPSLMEAGRQTGISFKNISAVCKEKRKTAGGFIWKYAE